MSLSTTPILEAAVDMVAKLRAKFPCEHFDIGSGHGDLIRLLRGKHELHSAACDYTDGLMELSDVNVQVADLNQQGLPYGDTAFDLVTCTEVIEHLEHYRSTIREMCRVLRPAAYARECAAFDGRTHQSRLGLLSHAFFA